MQVTFPAAAAAAAAATDDDDDDVADDFAIFSPAYFSEVTPG